MHSHHSGPPVDPDELRKLGFERRDVALKVIAKWVVAFFGFAVFSVVVAGLAFYYMVPEGIGSKPDRVRDRVPPEPRLQDNVTAKLDMWEMRREENERLHSYGWINQEKGLARVPIDEAIDMAASGVRPSAGGAPAPAREVPLSAEPGIRGDEH